MRLPSQSTAPGVDLEDTRLRWQTTVRAPLDERTSRQGARRSGSNESARPATGQVRIADLTLPLRLTLEQVAPSLPPAASTGRE